MYLLRNFTNQLYENSIQKYIINLKRNSYTFTNYEIDHILKLVRKSLYRPMHHPTTHAFCLGLMIDRWLMSSQRLIGRRKKGGARFMAPAHSCVKGWTRWRLSNGQTGQLNWLRPPASGRTLQVMDLIWAQFKWFLGGRGRVVQVVL